METISKIDYYVIDYAHTPQYTSIRSTENELKKACIDKTQASKTVLCLNYTKVFNPRGERIWLQKSWEAQWENVPERMF